MPVSSRNPIGIIPTPSPSASSSSSNVPRQIPSGREKSTRSELGKMKKDIRVKKDGDELEVEEFGPPGWRTILSRGADLGYPDFFPSRPGFYQPEDVLTEDNVKNGFNAKSFLATGAESFSMHGPIYNHLQNGCVDMLADLGQELIQKRNEAMPGIGERAFRIPVRVTYNDTKRSQFLSDLANPAVPLHRLMRNPVPHGFKGLELFEAMYAPATGPSAGSGHSRTPSGSGKIPSDPIPIDRAIWFIRVLAANEISAHRGRAQPTAVPISAPSPAAATPSSTNTNPTAPVVQLTSNEWYTQEFTGMLTSWLRVQLSHLALPTVFKGGPISAAVVKVIPSILADEKGRGRWVAKWEYGTTLLRELHSRHLVSSRILAGWLTDSLSNANLAQLGFIVQLLFQYLSSLVKHISIGRRFLRAACEKIKEARVSVAAESLKRVEGLLSFAIKAIFHANSDALISPTIWKQHAGLIREIIPISIDHRSHVARDTLEEVRHRSEALLIRPTMSESSSSPRRQQMEEIHKLDSISADTDMRAISSAFFDGTSSPDSTSMDMKRVGEKIFTLLNWSLGVSQLGAHRPYAVHTIIRLWSERFDKHQSKSSHPTLLDLHPCLYDWLDTSPAARKDENIRAIGIMFGELIRQGVFSYGRYMRSLIAKGQTTRSRRPGLLPSHHLAILREIPIFVDAKDLLMQRRIALCGDDENLRRSDEAREDEILETFKEEIVEYIPEVFGWKRYGRSAAYRDEVGHRLKSADAMTRYLTVRARFWLYPPTVKRLMRDGRTPPMDASTFMRVLRVYQLCAGYSTITDFLIAALKTSEDDEILLITLDTLRREGDAFTAIHRWIPIVEALMDRYHLLVERKQHIPALSALLLDLARKGHLAEDDRVLVETGIRQYLKSRELTRSAYLNPSESMGSVQQFIAAGDNTESTGLVPKLFSRHGSFNSWSTLWWQNVIFGIQAGAIDGNAAPAVLYSAIAHVIAVDGMAVGSMEEVIEVWVKTLSPAALLEMFGKRSAFTICHLLLHLVVQRRITSVPLVTRIVFPILKQASIHALAARGSLPAKYVHSVDVTIAFAQQLLLEIPPDREFPPTTLRQSYVLQTARATLFHRDHVQELIRHLPYLVVLRTASRIGDKLKGHLDILLRDLAMLPAFKTAAFRHLELLKEVFLSSEWSRSSLDSAVEVGMVDALKLIMSDGSTSSKSSSTTTASGSATRFSAWRWTRVVLEMRVEFKRLAIRIENGDDVAEARQALNQLVHATLDREASPDDADLLCETFRGIEPLAAQEILVVGVERLTTLLGQVIGTEHQRQLDALAASIDLMLRVISTTADSALPTPVDYTLYTARHKLLDVLSVAMQAIERLFTSGTEVELPDGIDPPEPGDMLKLVTKMLRFTLALQVTEPQGLATSRPDFSRLAVSYFRILLALIAQTKSSLDLSAIDMLVHIVDVAPLQSRAAMHAALTAEASTIDNADQNTWNLARALPYSSLARRHMSLATHGNGSGDPVAIDDRSWELFDYMATIPKRPRHRDVLLASIPIKDSASVSMAMFNPQPKRDAVPGTPDSLSDGEEEESETDEIWQSYVSERNIGDGLASEPAAARLLSSALYNGPLGTSAEEGVTKQPHRSTPVPLEAAGSPGTSEFAASAASRPRRMSTRITASNRLPTGSNRDPIDIDADEAEDKEEDNDSDVEITDAPPAKRAKIGSKSTGRPATAGKAPARKTVGGKSVAKKATGGKSVRGSTGGKAPKKGRRKSVAE